MRKALYLTVSVLLAVCLLICSCLCIQRIQGKELSLLGLKITAVTEQTATQELPEGAAVLTVTQDNYSPGAILVYKDMTGKLDTGTMSHSFNDMLVAVKDEATGTQKFPVSRNRIIGKQLLVIPGGGNALGYIQQPPVTAGLLLLLLALAAITFMPKIRKEGMRNDTMQPAAE